MNYLSIIGSLASKVNPWRAMPGRFKLFHFSIKIKILILFVKIDKI